jgi:hypothetical protein
VSGVLQLGFRADGEVQVAGERFVRYRLVAPVRGTRPSPGPVDS